MLEESVAQSDSVRSLSLSKYSQVSPELMNFFGPPATVAVVTGKPEGLQFPPRSLSSSGLMSSIDGLAEEDPLSSPTMGHGNPSE
ncbi:MAG: hypothetical protein ACJ0K4_07070 [Verrucomicrobiales bacterium]